MSNASLKEQLQAMASQLSDTIKTDKVKTDKLPAAPRSKANIQHVTKPTSAKSPQKPKPKWLEYVQYGVELLRAYFPACFKPINEAQPLKKGIKHDLIKRLSTLESIVTEDKACMVKSLAYYVNTSSYHKSVVEGATRIDLDGQAAGVVTAEEAKYSVERHQAKLNAKKNPATRMEANRKEAHTQ